MKKICKVTAFVVVFAIFAVMLISLNVKYNELQVRYDRVQNYCNELEEHIGYIFSETGIMAMKIYKSDGTYYYKLWEDPYFVEE